MKFPVPNYSCLQNPSLWGYRPQIPVLCVLCPQLNLLNPAPPIKIPGYATAQCKGDSILWQGVYKVTNLRALFLLASHMNPAKA